MGVKGLWQLIGNCGTPVSLESLEQKILAVDVSIWLHQAVRGFKGFGDAAVANAHLLTLFHRICKLLFYRIRPVFIFDGGVPQLKRHVISSRRLKREAAAGKAQKVRDRLLSNILKSHAVRKALGKKGPAPSSHYVSKQVKKEKDLFELPPLSKPLNDNLKKNFENTCLEDDDDGGQFCQNFSEKNLHNFDFDNEFKSLPLETQHEILSELQVTRKENSWNTLNKMPQESNNFSSFQMKRLLKRYQFQRNLDDIRSEIQKYNTAEMEASLFGDLEKHVSLTHKIISEDATHSILVKNVKEPPPSSSDQNKPLTFDTKSTKAEIKKDFLTELAKQGIVSSSFNQKFDNIESDMSESSDDTFSDNEDSLSSKQLKKQEEAAFLKAVEYVLDDGELTQEEIFSLIQQTKSEVESESPKLASEGKNKDIHEPSTSANAGGIVYNSDAESSTDEEDLIDVPDLGNVFNDNCEDTFDLKGKNDLAIGNQGSESNIASGSNIEKILGAKTDSLYIKILQQKLGEVVQSSKVKSFADSRSPPKLNNGKINASQLSSKHNITISLDFDKTAPLKDGIFSNIFNVAPKNINSEKISQNNNDKMLKSLSNKDSIDIVSKKSLNCNSSNNFENKNIEDLNDFILQSSSTKTMEKENLNKRDEPLEESLFDKSTVIDKQNLSKENNLNLSPSYNYIDNETQNKRNCKSFETNQSQPSNSNMFKKDKENFSLDLNKNVDVNKSMFTNSDLKDTFSEEQTVNSDSENLVILCKTTTKVEEESPTNSSLPEKEIMKSKNLIESKENYTENSDTSELPMKQSTEELEDLENQLSSEQHSLLHKINQEERVAADISDQVYGEAQELLKIFGLPYLVAPMEAEAQCAFLDMAGLTHGTITNDSDVFLFGGKRVYKNFFNQDKHVEYFTCDSIKHNIGLDRNKMISLAMLTGSDYTLGIESVGTILGMEILSDFPGTGIECLKNFKQWWNTSSKNNLDFHASKTRQRLSHLYIPESFPKEDIFKAYIQPVVDESREKFSWGAPNVEAVRTFTASKFGWNHLKADEIILPVLKKLGIRETQTRIDSYFNNIKLVKEPKIKSKRLEEAITRTKENSGYIDMHSPSGTNITNTKHALKRSLPFDHADIVQNIQPKKKRGKGSSKISSNDEVVEVEKEVIDIPLSKEKKKIEIYKKLQKKERITQLEKAREEKLNKKAEAVKVFSKRKKS